jgi:hypothetical protein
MALLTQANLTAPALADVTKTYAEMSVSRMQNTMIPMPPLPATPATSAEVATLQKWINAGYPSGSCGGGGIAPPVLDGGAAEASASAYTTPTVCTSMVTWTRGNGQTMRPGEACISCHSRGDGPAFAIAGTIYPSAHEPDDCNGASATTNGATVVITDKSGTARTLTPDAVGNFSYSGTLATPFQAKVVQAGKERIMVTPQTSGDCNGCHTQTGANGAPGRIMLP